MNGPRDCSPHRLSADCGIDKLGNSIVQQLKKASIEQEARQPSLQLLTRTASLAVSSLAHSRTMSTVQADCWRLPLHRATRLHEREGTQAAANHEGRITESAAWYGNSSVRVDTANSYAQ